MYGLIVIGDDLSSHVAAAVACRHGIKTALLAESGMGDVCFIGDLAFTMDHTPAIGMDANNNCLSLLAGLDIPVERTMLDPAYQIILPENRIDFFNDKDALVKELSREFPEMATQIKSFYDAASRNAELAAKWLYSHSRIQPESMRDYLDYVKLIPYLVRCKYDKMKLDRLMSQNASFKKVMEAQDILLSFKTNDTNTLFSNFMYCSPFRGAYHFAQGKQTLFDSLINKMESVNGLYVNHCEVLSIKRGRLIEVTYMDRNGTASKIEADNLIISTKWPNRHLLIDRKKKLSFGDFIRPVKISHYPFTIHLGIKPGCIPEKMARHVAVISDVEKDIYDNNLIILESNIKEGEKNTPISTKIPLSATVFLPAGEDDVWSNDSLVQTADSVIERLEYFLPFLKENIELFDIDESISISKKQREIVNPKYQVRKSFITGFAAKSNKTRFKNVYMTGASLMADTGFEGEIISGINAALRIAGKTE